MTLNEYDDLLGRVEEFGAKVRWGYGVRGDYEPEGYSEYTVADGLGIDRCRVTAGIR